MSTPEGINLGEFAGLPVPSAGETASWGGEESDRFHFAVVDTPRVGVDGLREALVAKYGTIGSPPATEQLGAPEEE